MISSESRAIHNSGKRFPSRPTGYLLSRFGLLVLVAGLLLAVWYSQMVIVILLTLALSSAGLAKLWSMVSLVGVHCERLLSDKLTANRTMVFCPS